MKFTLLFPVRVPYIIFIYFDPGGNFVKRAHQHDSGSKVAFILNAGKERKRFDDIKRQIFLSNPIILKHIY